MLSLVVPIVGRRWPRSAFPLAVAAVLASTTAAGLGLATVMQHGTQRYFFGGWPPPVGIEYVLDHVSAFVALVITGVSLFVIIATRRLVNDIAADRLGPYYSVVLLLLTGITGIVITGDLFNLFVFLEIASIAAYTLVFMGGRAGMLAGFRYLILGTIGSSLYLLGVGFLYFSTGTLNMAEMQELLAVIEESRSVQAAAIFIFVGLGLKMALVPLHLWLPDAYTFAPSAVNSLLAPIMTKAAAYAMLRMFLSVFPEGSLREGVPVADALVLLGLAGVILGPLLAVAQQDIRRMLAYSSIGQLGLIAAGIGMATPLGFIAALLHIMNHTVMKAALFLAAAAIRSSTGSSQIRDMTGLGRKMPLTMAGFTLGSIAMIGIPPSAGFFSKWYLAQAGAAQGQWLLVALVLGSSLLTAAYLFKVLERAYLQPLQSGTPDHDEHRVEEESPHAGPAHASSASVALEAKPQLNAQTASINIKEAPLDVVMPTLFLSVMTIVLGIMNVVIVTRVLEPAV